MVVLPELARVSNCRVVQSAELRACRTSRVKDTGRPEAWANHHTSREGTATQTQRAQKCLKFRTPSSSTADGSKPPACPGGSARRFSVSGHRPAIRLEGILCRPNCQRIRAVDTLWTDRRCTNQATRTAALGCCLVRCSPRQGFFSTMGGVLTWLETARSRRSIGPLPGIRPDPRRLRRGCFASDVNEGLGDALTSLSLVWGIVTSLSTPSLFGNSSRTSPGLERPRDSPDGLVI